MPCGIHACFLPDNPSPPPPLRWTRCRVQTLFTLELGKSNLLHHLVPRKFRHICWSQVSSVCSPLNCVFPLECDEAVQTQFGATTSDGANKTRVSCVFVSLPFFLPFMRLSNNELSEVEMKSSARGFDHTHARTPTASLLLSVSLLVSRKHWLAVSSGYSGVNIKGEMAFKIFRRRTTSPRGLNIS